MEKAIKKEKSNPLVSFKPHYKHTIKQVQNGEAHELVGFQEITYHIISNVKMDFRWKERFVAND